jgi:hypothetical protein
MQAIHPLHPSRLFGGLVLLALLAMPDRAAAGDEYYLLMFGSQRIPNNPNYSHSFATFVHVWWPGDCPMPPFFFLEAHTISWLPQSMRVRTNALCAEPGWNVPLDTTLRYVLDSGERVSLWGPYPIEPELYFRAMRRIAQLESGEVRYKADDSGRNDNRVSNCIHAVGAIADGIRIRVASPGWGEVASYVILQRLRPWIIDRNAPQRRLATALGLDCYPIIYRDYQAPRSGAIYGPIYRLFGGERYLRASFGPPS